MMIFKNRKFIFIIVAIIIISIPILVIATENPLKYRLKGNYYINIGRYDDAFDAFSEGYLKHPDNTSLIYGLAKSTFSQKKYTSSISYYRQLLLKKPEKPVYHNGLSMAYLASDRYIEAVIHIDTALERDSDNYEYHYNRGLIYKKTEDFSAALESFTRAHEIKPSVEKIIYRQAEMYIELEDYNSALTAYESLLENNSKDDMLLNNIGYIYSMMDREEEAITYYESAIKHNPFDHTAYNNKADSLYRLKRYDESIDVYEKVLELDSENEYAYESILKIIYTIEDYREMIKYADIQYSRNPENENYLVWKAKALTKLGMIDESSTVLEQALIKNPENDIAIDEVGFIFYIKGYYRKAIDSFNHAISINPYKESYYHNKVRAVFKIYDYNYCIDVSRLSEKLFGENLLTLEYKMKSYNELGEYRKALEQAERIVSLQPGSIDSYLIIAEELIHLQQYEAAQDFAEKALGLDVYNNEARVLLETIQSDNIPLNKKLVEFIKENYLYIENLNSKQILLNDFMDMDMISQLEIMDLIENIRDERDTDSFFVTDSMYNYYKNEESKIESHYINPKTLYVKIKFFNEKTTPALWNILRNIENTENLNLVIDLRDNPGGTMRSGTEIIDILLPEVYFSYKIDNKGYVESLYSSPFQLFFKNIYIFVNDKSAGTSEIMVTSLKEHLNNVTVIGLPTKGSYIGLKELIDYQNNLILYLASFHWNVENDLVSGKIIPDIEIKSDKEDLYFDNLNKLLK